MDGRSHELSSFGGGRLFLSASSSIQDAWATTQYPLRNIGNAGYSPLQFWTALALRRAFPGPSVKLNGAIGYRRRRRRRQLHDSGKKRDVSILTGKTDGACGACLPLSIVLDARGESRSGGCWMPLLKEDGKEGECRPRRAEVSVQPTAACGRGLRCTSGGSHASPPDSVNTRTEANRAVLSDARSPTLTATDSMHPPLPRNSACMFTSTPDRHT